METKHFRNHFSFVLENMGVTLVGFILLIISNTDDIIEASAENSGELLFLLVVFGIMLLILSVILGIHTLVWSKTWITINDDTITIETNTINRSKNTIGIKNISNVNTEQNIFENIIGTCKLKLDTNTLTTANETDVMIVLKKNQAEEIRKHLVKRINELNSGVKQQEEISDFDDDNENYDIVADAKEIILNGLYSTNIIVVIVALLSFGGVVLSIVDVIENGITAESIGGTVGSIFAIGTMLFATVSSIVRTFLGMYGFKAKRDESRLYIKYGLFKKVNFAIPVDKINAIKIHQTFIARLCNKYTAEMINIGMGDEENSTAYFTFYGSKEKLQKTIDVLLPEFSEAVLTKCERQPKAVCIVKVLRILKNTLIFGAIALGVMHFVKGIWDTVVIVIFITIIVYMVISHVLTYFYNGTSITNDYLGIREGAFSTCKTIIKFDKIQYITFRQNLLEKKLGIIRGDAMILAMALSNTQMMSYIKEEKVDEIKKYLIDWRN